MSDNIRVELTEGAESPELHCFKLVFNARAGSTDAERAPLEIYLHTTQAIDLFSQLASKLSEYMHQASAELLRLRGVGL
jgi:hypothetical protein